MSISSKRVMSNRCIAVACRVHILSIHQCNSRLKLDPRAAEFGRRRHILSLSRISAEKIRLSRIAGVASAAE